MLARGAPSTEEPPGSMPRGFLCYYCPPCASVPSGSSRPTFKPHSRMAPARHRYRCRFPGGATATSRRICAGGGSIAGCGGHQSTGRDSSSRSDAVRSARVGGHVRIPPSTRLYVARYQCVTRVSLTSKYCAISRAVHNVSSATIASNRATSTSDASGFSGTAGARPCGSAVIGVPSGSMRPTC
jgi:hypothetical protein